MLGWFVPALGLADRQYPSIALQPGVTLEGTKSSAQEPLETDVWADPAPGPQSLSMSTTGPGIHSPEPQRPNSPVLRIHARKLRLENVMSTGTRDAGQYFNGPPPTDAPGSSPGVL